MKKSVVSTFLISFVLIFSISLTIYIYFFAQNVELIGMHFGHPSIPSLLSPNSLAKIWILFFLSGFIAVLVALLNYADIQRCRSQFIDDIAKISENEEPDLPEMKKLSQHIKALSSEIQHLSNPTTEMQTEVIEEERKRISRELHDSVSQELFAATMILSSVQASKDLKTLQAQSSLALKILHEAQNEMRAMLLHLRPVELSGKSLSIGLTSLINELSAKISANINYRLDEVHSKHVIEDNLFRMAQEVLSNTLRHAHAENIEIVLHESKNNILLRIKDDGVGFDLDEKMADGKSTSYGLSNLRERALLLGGSCQVISAPNQGTTVEIKVPKNDTDENEENADKQNQSVEKQDKQAESDELAKDNNKD